MLGPLVIPANEEMEEDCHPEPVVVRNTHAYVGCYAEGVIDEVDVTRPSNMKLVQCILGIDSSQRLKVEGNYLLVTSGVSGGTVYQIDMGALN
jgi:hypothetical protein